MPHNGRNEFQLAEVVHSGFSYDRSLIALNKRQQLLFISVESV